MGFQPTKLHNPGNDAAYTLVVLLSLASRILGNETEDADARERLEELVQTTPISAKTAKQKGQEMGQEGQTFDDWAENLDSENF